MQPATEILPAIQPQVSDSIAIVEQLTRGEVDMQVSTAKRYPRSVTAFKQQSMALACLTPATAESCFYTLKRSGKPIIGPSIRLAEIIATTWGNIRAECRIVSAGDREVVAQATAWDMQTNVLIRVETSRRITTKDGRRFNDDMVIVTGNAAASIALRNAIYRIVPRPYVDEIMAKCMQVAATKGGGFENARATILASLIRLGVEKHRIFALVEKNGVADLDVTDVAMLQGALNSLRDGQATADELFGSAPIADGKTGFGFRGSKKPKQKDEQPPVESGTIPESESPSPVPDSD